MDYIKTGDYLVSSIFSKEKFDGAEENLQILMDNNACVFRDLARSGNVLPDFQKLIATFIQLVGSFMFSKSTGSTNQVSWFLTNGR